MALRDNVRARREELGLSMAELGRRAGLSATQIREIEMGENEDPRGSTLLNLAKALELPLLRLLAPGSYSAGELGSEVLSEMIREDAANYGASTDHDKPREVHAVSVPIQAVLVGGPPGEAMEDTGERYDLLHHHWRPGRSVIRIKGDSMWPTFCSGDLLLVDEKAKVKEGDAAVVRIGGESTVKRVSYRKKNAGLLLRGDNPTFPVIEADGDDVQILGRVISIVERKL